MKKLAIDQITNSFNFNKNDKVLGPWCFKENITLESVLKNKYKKFYIENKIDQLKGFKCCEEQYERILKKIAKYLKSQNNSNFSLKFFENYVGYWLLDFIHLVHYSKRLSDLYKSKYRNEKIELLVKYKDANFEFIDTLDYLNKTYKNTKFFSHFVLTFILQNKPKKWNIKKLQLDNKKIFYKKKTSFFLKLKRSISNLLFARVRLVYGFNIFEKIIISLILIFTKPKIKFNKHNNFCTLIKPSKLSAPVNDLEMIQLIKRYIPKSFLEIYKKKNNFFFNCKDKVMLGSSSSLLKDDEKFEPLLFRELGGKIISVQHGSAYGDASVSLHHCHEYLFDKFISWGQVEHQNYKVKFYPLPSPQLRKKIQPHKIKNNKKILFVSTSNLFVQPKYLKMRSFQESCNRLKNSYLFLKNIKSRFHQHILYKDSPFGHFSEKELFKKNFKNINFINKIPENYIPKVKLVIMNNYSTFFFKSLSMNIPTILFCEKNCWDSTSKAKKLFNELNKVGIIYHDPKKAAKKLNKNIFDWWYSDKTQKARKLFCNEFALSDRSTFKTWIKFFLNGKL